MGELSTDPYIYMLVPLSHLLECSESCRARGWQVGSGGVVRRESIGAHDGFCRDERRAKRRDGHA